jgi:hypothetical protein
MTSVLFMLFSLWLVLPTHYPGGMPKAALMAIARNMDLQVERVAEWPGE